MNVVEKYNEKILGCGNIKAYTGINLTSAQAKIASLVIKSLKNKEPNFLQFTKKRQFGKSTLTRALAIYSAIEYHKKYTIIICEHLFAKKNTIKVIIELLEKQGYQNIKIDNIAGTITFQRCGDTESKVYEIKIINSFLDNLNIIRGSRFHESDKNIFVDEYCIKTKDTLDILTRLGINKVFEFSSLPASIQKE